MIDVAEGAEPMEMRPQPAMSKHELSDRLEEQLADIVATLQFK